MEETIGEKSPRRIQISDNIRRELSKVLNEVHGVNFSYRFWGIILEEYVTSVLTLEKTLKKNEKIPKADKYPVNSHTFLNFNEKLKYDAKKFIKHIISKSKREVLSNYLKEFNHLRFGFPEVKEDQLKGEELPVIHLHVTGFSGRNKRNLVTEISKRYSNPLIQNAIFRIPKIYVEFFQKLCEQVPVHKPEQKVFHVHNLRTFYDHLLIALYVENGAKLIWYQHGSHYGEYNHEYLHHLEHSFADEYRTWGWQIKEKDMPWKAYRLEKFKQEYDGYSNLPKNDLLIIYPKMYHKYRKHCVAATEHLLRNLNFNQYTNVTARPRPLHQKCGHESELEFITDERIKVSSGLTPIAKEVSESRLVVQLNVPGTNFLECIYVDHPVSGLLTNTDPTDIIKPYYTFFLENGVLHNSPESLVDFLNNTDLDSWWSVLREEPAYKKFKKTFTSNSESENFE